MRVNGVIYSIKNKMSCIALVYGINDYDRSSVNAIKSLIDDVGTINIDRENFGSIIQGVYHTEWQSMISSSSGDDEHLGLKRHVDYIDSSDQIQSFCYTGTVPMFIEYIGDSVEFKMADIVLYATVFAETDSELRLNIGNKMSEEYDLSRSYSVKSGETRLDLFIVMCSAQFNKFSLETVSGEVSKIRVEYVMLDRHLREIFTSRPISDGDLMYANDLLGSIVY